MKILDVIKKIIKMDFVTSIIKRYLADDKVHEYILTYRQRIEESEHAFVESADDKRDKARLVLLQGLVLSYLPDDVHCGITILQDLLLRARTPKQKRKAMNLLAIGYFKIGNLSKSQDYVSRCLEIKPRWFLAMTVGCIVHDRDLKERRRNLLMDSAMGIGLVTGLFGSTTLLLDPTWVMEAVRLEFLAKKGVKKVVTGSLPDNSNPLQMHEEMYLLAHRYYIRGHLEDMPRCNYLIDRCLEIAPEWKPAMTLKRRMKYASMKAYIDKIVSDSFPYALGGFIGVCLCQY